MGQLNIISSSSSLALIIIISLVFVIFGVLYSKKYRARDPGTVTIAVNWQPMTLLRSVTFVLSTNICVLVNIYSLLC